MERGEIYKMKLTADEGVNPKFRDDTFRFKFFVVMGQSADGSLIGFVLINSCINPHLSEEIRNCHYPIRPDDYPFLLHRSFINCGDLKQITLEKFNERYDANCYYGKLNDADLDLVVRTLQNAMTVTPKQLKKFGLLD